MITDLIPSDILDYHRVQDPTVTALFYEPGKSEGGGSGKSEGGKEAGKSTLCTLSFLPFG